MLEQIPGEQRVTVGADKAYDTRDFVQECRNLRVTPHVAQNIKRSGGSAIDERTTRHGGYYSPHFLDDRKRLDRLTKLGFVWREEPPYPPHNQLHNQPFSLPPVRYRLTEQGQRELAKGRLER